MNPAEIMQDVDIIGVIAVVLAFSLGFVGLAGGLTIGLVKAWRGDRKIRTTELDAEEAQAFQELQRGFQRMDERVQSLETLILDREKHDRFSVLND